MPTMGTRTWLLRAFFCLFLILLAQPAPVAPSPAPPVPATAGANKALPDSRRSPGSAVNAYPVLVWSPGLEEEEEEEEEEEGGPRQVLLSLDRRRTPAEGDGDHGDGLWVMGGQVPPRLFSPYLSGADEVADILESLLPASKNGEHLLQESLGSAGVLPEVVAAPEGLLPLVLYDPKGTAPQQWQEVSPDLSAVLNTPSQRRQWEKNLLRALSNENNIEFLPEEVHGRTTFPLEVQGGAGTSWRRENLPRTHLEALADTSRSRRKRVFLSRGWGPGGYEAIKERRPVRTHSPEEGAAGVLDAFDIYETLAEAEHAKTYGRHNPRRKIHVLRHVASPGLPPSPGGAHYEALVWAVNHPFSHKGPKSSSKANLKQKQKPLIPRRFHSMFTSGTWSPLGKRNSAVVFDADTGVAEKGTRFLKKETRGKDGGGGGVDVVGSKGVGRNDEGGLEERGDLKTPSLPGGDGKNDRKRARDVLKLTLPGTKRNGIFMSQGWGAGGLPGGLKAWWHGGPSAYPLSLRQKDPLQEKLTNYRHQSHHDNEPRTSALSSFPPDHIPKAGTTEAMALTQTTTPKPSPKLRFPSSGRSPPAPIFHLFVSNSWGPMGKR
ncbi:uncharacterized protein LOC143025436 [Oratosquilla oratoria]|uniref:uncharacterized protein LOC143025436 n=1 Tax=Oratosquilla oratoria TaxID=337810 RepID=UPI003F767F4F